MSRQTDEMARYFASHGIKNRSIAERLGLTEQTVCNMLKGRDSLGKKRCLQLSEAYGFDLNFLLSGAGTLFPATQSIVNSGNVTGNGNSVNISQTNAALQAENERLRNEVEWLRQQLAK